MKGSRSWFLPNARIKARSCGKCKILFLWGETMDKLWLNTHAEDVATRICPHCVETLSQGELSMLGDEKEGALFHSDEIPEFHSSWLGHEIIDRFFMKKWKITVKKLPANSCSKCHYTEVAGKSIYKEI